MAGFGGSHRSSRQLVHRTCRGEWVASASDNLHRQRTIALMDPEPRQTWHNFSVLQGRAGTRARHFRIWVVATAAAALAVSYAAPTDVLADHAWAQERRLTPLHTASAQTASRALAVLLTSTSAVRPRSAPASRPPAAIHVPTGGFQELLRYHWPPLLSVALTCLIVLLLIIGIRRRRTISAGSVPVRRRRRRIALGSTEPGAAHGRHAVAGPAGSGAPPTGWHDFARLTVRRRAARDPAIGRFGSATPRHPGDPPLDGPGLSGPAPYGPVPVVPADAGNDAPARDVPPSALQARFEPWDKSNRKPSGGPPWEPAEKPAGELSAVPTNAAWERNDTADPPRDLNCPVDGTDVPPPDGTHR